MEIGKPDKELVIEPVELPAEPTAVPAEPLAPADVEPDPTPT